MARPMMQTAQVPPKYKGCQANDSMIVEFASRAVPISCLPDTNERQGFVRHGRHGHHGRGFYSRPAGQRWAILSRPTSFDVHRLVKGLAGQRTLASNRITF